MNPRRFVPLLLLVAASSAPAQWHRLLLSGKGNSRSPAAAHPLSYFTHNPFLRDGGDSLCTDCRTPTGKAASATRFVARVTRRPIGRIHGIPVLQLDYSFAPRGNQTIAQASSQESPFSLTWVSILVRSSPGQYREVFQLQDPPASLKPARIVHLPGGGDILAFNNSDGGNGGGCFEGYWQVTPTGAPEIDFAPLTRAITARLPPRTRFTSSCWALDLDHARIHSAVQKADATCHACGYTGTVDATFRLEGHVARPVKIVYSPGEP